MGMSSGFSLPFLPLCHLLSSFPQMLPPFNQSLSCAGVFFSLLELPCLLTELTYVPRERLGVILVLYIFVYL